MNTYIHTPIHINSLFRSFSGDLSVHASVADKWGRH